MYVSILQFTNVKMFTSIYKCIGTKLSKMKQVFRGDASNRVLV